jgi:hypothetical protein
VETSEKSFDFDDNLAELLILCYRNCMRDDSETMDCNRKHLHEVLLKSSGHVLECFSPENARKRWTHIVWKLWECDRKILEGLFAFSSSSCSLLLNSGIDFGLNSVARFLKTLCIERPSFEGASWPYKPSGDIDSEQKVVLPTKLLEDLPRLSITALNTRLSHVHHDSPIHEGLFILGFVQEFKTLFRSDHDDLLTELFLSICTITCKHPLDIDSGKIVTTFKTIFMISEEQKNDLSKQILSSQKSKKEIKNSVSSAIRDKILEGVSRYVSFYKSVVNSLKSISSRFPSFKNSAQDRFREEVLNCMWLMAEQVGVTCLIETNSVPEELLKLFLVDLQFPSLEMLSHSVSIPRFHSLIRFAITGLKYSFSEIPFLELLYAKALFVWGILKVHIREIDHGSLLPEPDSKALFYVTESREQELDRSIAFEEKSPENPKSGRKKKKKQRSRNILESEWNLHHKASLNFFNKIEDDLKKDWLVGTPTQQLEFFGICQDLKLKLALHQAKTLFDFYHQVDEFYLKILLPPVFELNDPVKFNQRFIPSERVKSSLELLISYLRYCQDKLYTSSVVVSILQDVLHDFALMDIHFCTSYVRILQEILIKSLSDVSTLSESKLSNAIEFFKGCVSLHSLRFEKFPAGSKSQYMLDYYKRRTLDFALRFLHSVSLSGIRHIILHSAKTLVASGTDKETEDSDLKKKVKEKVDVWRNKFLKLLTTVLSQDLPIHMQIYGTRAAAEIADQD